MWQVIQVEAKFAELPMTVRETEEYLEHHGILGMRWGVRRYQNKDGTLTDAGKKRYLNEDGTYNKTAFKEIPDTAFRATTTAELQQRINRLNLERQYLNMIDPKKNSAVKAIVGTILAKIGTASAKAISAAVTKAIDKKVNPEEKKKEKISDYSKKELKNLEDLDVADLKMLNNLLLQRDQIKQKLGKP